MVWKKRVGAAGMVLLCTGVVFALEIVPSATRGTKQDQPGVQSATASQHQQKDATPTTNGQTGKVSGVPVNAKAQAALPGGVDIAAAPKAGVTRSATARQGGEKQPPLNFRDDPCVDAIATTGAFNGVNGYVSFRDPSNSTYDVFEASAVNIGSDSVVGGIITYQMSVPNWAWTGNVDYMILDGSSGAPDDNNIIAQGTDILACGTDTGELVFGYYHMWIYAIYPNINVPAGTWFTALRPVGPQFGNYWATADGAGYTPYWKGDYWTGGVWAVQAANFSYCWVPGFTGGACCTGGDCAEMSQQDCINGGGTFQGDGVPCCMVICPGRAAGCCFPDGTCQDMKPADCNAAGGVYQGEQNLCRPGLCPLPDPCDGTHGNVVYNNSVWDGVNGLFNTRSTDGSGFIDAEIVDDVFFCDVQTTLQSLHWYDMKYVNYAYTGTADWYLWDTSGTGGSPGNVVYGGETIGAAATELDTGQQLFGYEIWQNSIDNIGQAVAGGLYWVGMRPNQSVYSGPAYWATAPQVGLEGWFKSAVFGYPNFVKVSTQIGPNEDFAFCVVGDVSGTKTGACCNNGDCAMMTQTDCNNSGGTYSGDCTTCFPNVCPGAPGACCFPDGTCQFLKPGDCDAAGGSFTQSGQQCTVGLCPIPDPCDGTHGNVVYNNSVYDGVDGLFNTRSTDGSGVIDAQCVDDVFLCDQQTTLQSLHWYDLKSTYNYTGTSDWYFYDTTGGGGSPGNVVYGGETNGVASFELDTGQLLFGYHIWQNNINDINQAVAPGLYWVGMRPNQSSYAGPAYWATAPLVGLEAYFRSNFFGYPNWVHVSTQFGSKEDFAFCVVGDITGKFTGACCNNGDCVNMSQTDCTNSGGTYQGDCTTCVPNTCPGAPGACCASDFTCQELKPADCDASGGTFLGSGTSCTPNPCGALACQDALYDNGQPDGVNDLTSERGNASGITSYTADDAQFSQTVTIQDFHFYGATGANYGWNGAGDLIVVNDGGSCNPTDTITEQQNLPQTRIDLGFSHFGYEVYLYTFDNLNIQLSAGTFWFGARAVGGPPNFDRGWWATAPAQSCNAQIKSAYFGYPDWTDWSNLGITADVAFCITGHTGESTEGGCCIDGDCTLMSQQDCSNAGGTYQGNGTSCFPNTCPGAPGACCASDFSCTVVKPRDCSGTFLGSGTTCSPNPCAGLICQDALYDNGQPDGTNGLTNERGNASGITSLTADDVSISQTVTVTDFHFYGMTGNNYGWNGTGDFIVVTDGGNCNPTDTVIESQDIAQTRLDLGYTLFGYEVYIYTFDGLNVQLSAGTYWFGARPVGGGGSYDRSWWATAPAQSCNAQIRSTTFFGDNNWHDWTALGITADVAFCITGQVGESKLGACCNNGDCTLLSETDCQNSGGVYQGNGTSCSPNLCPGAIAACCFTDGTCQNLKKVDCDSAGGTYQGEGTKCAPGLCPIPDPCTDAVYNNSAYDQVNGFADQRDDGLGIDAINVSDIDLGTTTTLSSVHWYSVDDGGINPSTFDFFQLNDDGNCAPDPASEAVTSDINLSSRLDTGNIVFNRHVFQYNGPVTTTLNGGQSYFLGMRPHTTGNFAGQSFILTAPRDTCPTYFKSAFFGVPDYTPVVDVFGNDEDTAWCAVAGGNPCEGIVLGDSNGDGLVDFNDIDCFVAALIGQDAWAACGTKYPASAYLCANDVNKDGSVDFNDIDTFVTCIINSGCP